MAIGPLSFAAPWVLLALAGLPIIWWLLRALPPAPQRVRFPALLFLLDLKSDEETPVRMPWWLLLLRMAIAASIVVGLAGPALNAAPPAAGTGALVLVVDNGWTSAANWQAIKQTGAQLARSAAEAGRPVVLVRTAQSGAQSFAPQSGAKTESQIAAMVPSPWRPQRAAALDAWLASGLAPETADLVFLSDGLAHDGDGTFAQDLAGIGRLGVFVPARESLAHALRPPVPEADALVVPLIRPENAPAEDLSLTAYGDQGRIIANAGLKADAGQSLAEARLSLPQEARNEIRRIALDGHASAGAVTLLDDRWTRPSVGLVSGGGFETEQPLLSDIHYLERALAPYADVRVATLEELLQDRLSTLILADTGRIVGEDYERISAFVTAGGLLVRFAGPRMASQSDDLVPLRLRQGGRTIGGALSWEDPQRLGSFDEKSPFRGLNIPGDVAISKQVLVEPSLQVGERTWARLVDGTPLVTAAQRGQGHIVLFHVTATPDWSNLPLSGLFVDMLRRVLAYAGDKAGPSGLSAQAGKAGSLAPLRTLDGFGTLRGPPGSAKPIAFGAIDTIRPSADHPPGIYGSPSASFVLNTVAPTETLATVQAWPAGALVQTLSGESVRRFGPWLLAAALALLIADGFAALALSGRLNRLRAAPGAATGLALLAAAIAIPAESQAQEGVDGLMASALETRLAFVETGDAATDAMSLAGLEGLSRRIAQKTALDPAAPAGLSIETDELSLYPLLYWPMVPGMSEPSQAALARIDRYLKTGGMILFDTRDQDLKASSLGRATPNELSLRAVLGLLDIPPLEPIPENHVLHRSFYLLADFPGRFAGGEIWVESNSAEADVPGSARSGSMNDGVSSVIIGAHDWAAAWATDRGGRPLAPVIPGSERQREYAYRFGINVAMYALTGNYKADQVHTRALIERLGE